MPRVCHDATRSPFEVAAGDWRTACLHAKQDGGRFEGLFAGPRDARGRAARGVQRAATTRVIVCRPPARAVESIVDEIPAAAWDEREAADTHGLRFVGHEPLRPLVDHRAPLDAWTVPVTGHDTHQVAVGPIHAGVIESGHFRFHVVGERVLHLDVQLFYKRRGLEAAATARPLSDAIAYAQRACGACAVANTVAYAHACEAALGLHPTISCAAAGRCCSNSSASTTTSTTSRRSAPASGSRRERWRTRRSKNARNASICA